MNLQNERYTGFALVREMIETVDTVRRFAGAGSLTPATDQLLLTGEGSSRIFPAKRLRAQALREGSNLRVVTEGASQALEYPLDEYHVFIASNSGKTAEGVRLLRALREKGGARRITAVAAYEDSPIPKEADDAYILRCGSEEAVAATKSVVEQALLYDFLYRRWSGLPRLDLGTLADHMEQVLGLDVPRDVVEFAVGAPIIYFAGRNDGVAEELTLKTNEITRKKSDFLEGTYGVHGIEEVMRPEELVVLVDPFPEEEEKFQQVLEKGVGLKIVAIADRETRFPTIPLPRVKEGAPYLQLLAGWNLLVEIGLAAGVDLDKPERARKVGNEYTG